MCSVSHSGGFAGAGIIDFPNTLCQNMAFSDRWELCVCAVVTAGYIWCIFVYICVLFDRSAVCTLDGHLMCRLWYESQTVHYRSCTPLLTRLSDTWWFRVCMRFCSCNLVHVTHLPTPTTPKPSLQMTNACKQRTCFCSVKKAPSPERNPLTSIHKTVLFAAQHIYVCRWYEWSSCAQTSCSHRWAMVRL